MKLFSTPPVLSGKKNKKRKKLLKAQRKALKRADHPFESDKAADCRGVVLSNRAYLSVLSEVYSRDPLETGGIFFGNVKNAVWYVAEASDPGVYTLHTRAHHEMDNNYHNHIYLCKPPVYRKTPLGREIADLLVAVNRPYSKSDYIPCIAWGRNARYVSTFEVGTRLRVWGRVQSREPSYNAIPIP